jgi:hypothetical protein
MKALQSNSDSAAIATEATERVTKGTSNLANLSQANLGWTGHFLGFYECSTGPAPDQAVNQAVNQALPASACKSARDVTGQWSSRQGPKYNREYEDAAHEPFARY